MPYVLKDEECQKDGSHNCEDQRVFPVAVYPMVLIAAYCHGAPPLAFLTAIGMRNGLWAL
jgi:hypothetical protein